MPEYLSPGVYVEEIDGGPKPIEAAGTAMPAFVGFTERAELQCEIDGELITQDLLNKPQLVTNWSQYVERFGEFVGGAYMPLSVYGYFNNGGGRCYVVSVKTIGKAQAPLLGTDGKPYLIARAKQSGFGGLRLRVKVDAPEAPAPKAKAKGKDDKGAAPEGPEPFDITVERQGISGAWLTGEVVSGVTLEEMEVEGVKKVQVLYKNNRAPKLIDIVVPEGKLALAKVWPKSQETSLNLE
jgi:hypothetical protein